jgi:hypothetical protein
VAKTSQFGIVDCHRTEGSCGSNLNAQCNRNFATARAQRINGQHILTEWHTGNAGAGFPSFMMPFLTFPLHSYCLNSVYDGSSYLAFTSEFINNNSTAEISFEDDNYMTVRSGEHETWIEVWIWVPQDDSVNGIVDTIPTLEKALWHGKATLIYRTLLIEGELVNYASFFKLTTTGTE